LEIEHDLKEFDEKSFYAHMKGLWLKFEEIKKEGHDSVEEYKKTEEEFGKVKKEF